MLSGEPRPAPEDGRGRTDTTVKHGRRRRKGSCRRQSMQYDVVIVGADPVGLDPAGRWGRTELSGYVRAIRRKIAAFACKQGTEGFSFGCSIRL